MGSGRWYVEVTGLRQVFDALNEWDRKSARVIDRMITDAGRDVARNARTIAPDQNPVSNWGAWKELRRGRDLAFEPTAVAAGFRVRKNNYRRRGIKAGIAWEVVQSNPAGAIFEVMGDKSRVTTPAGEHLVNMINARFKGTAPRTRPRTLIPAYYSVMTEALRERIRQTIIDEARRAGLD